MAGCKRSSKGKAGGAESEWTCDDKNRIQQGRELENAGALRSWKGQGNGFSPSVFRRSTALLIH